MSIRIEKPLQRPDGHHAGVEVGRNDHLGDRRYQLHLPVGETDVVDIVGPGLGDLAEDAVNHRRVVGIGNRQPDQVGDKLGTRRQLGLVAADGEDLAHQLLGGFGGIDTGKLQQDDVLMGAGGFYADRLPC